MAVAVYSRRRAAAYPSGRDSATCIVGTELLPAMDPATGMQENAVVLSGFFTGIALMLALKILLTEYNCRRKP